MKQLESLEQIASNLQEFPDVLGLIALGSVGLERDRLDEFSDLDFFVVVKDGEKRQFLSNLAWLEIDNTPVLFHFQDTSDGIKVIWSDGLYGEFAIFEISELSAVLAAGAKIIWQREHVALDINFEKNIPDLHEADYYFNNALTNIYVAKLRHARGEILSADTFMTSALSHLMLGISLSRKAEGEFIDKFDKSRRFEQHFPDEAQRIQEVFGNLSDFNQALRGISSIIERYFEIPSAIRKVIFP